MKLAIQDCLPIINQMPVASHGFVTKRDTWRKSCESQNPNIESLNNQIFGSDENLTVTRQDCFDSAKGDIDLFVLKVIYWGYSSGFGFKKAMNDVLCNPIYFKILTDRIHLNKGNINIQDTRYLIDSLSQINGIGLSTISKLWYFQELKIKSLPCLILDLKLIEVFKSKLFKDFDELSEIEYGSIDWYYRYLGVMNNVKKEYQIDDAGKLEMFLFLVGDKLKGFSNAN